MKRPETLRCATTRARGRSTEHLAGDGVEPVFSEQRLLRTHGTRRVDRAEPASALHVRQHAVDRHINARDRDAVVRSDDAVAGVDELGLAGRLASQELDDGGGAYLG